MYLVNYIVCIITLIIIDAPYLYLNSDLYVQKTKSISNASYTNRWYSALIVYIALALGIVVLTVPHVRKDNWNVMIRDSILYGGVSSGALVLPTHVFKILFTLIFPPLGEIMNCVSAYLVDNFPYITWDAIKQIFDYENLTRIIYAYVLTSMFYIPGLI